MLRGIVVGGVVAAVLFAAGCGGGDNAAVKSTPQVAAKIGVPVAAVQGPSGNALIVGIRKGGLMIGKPKLNPRIPPPVGVGQQRAACVGTDGIPGDASTASIVQAVLCLHNAERQSRGLAPVALNARLSAAAQKHAADMARNRYFSHDSRSGATFIDRVKRAGYRFISLGENIAAGIDADGTPAGVMSMWLHSSGHRANILRGKFREIGIGVAPGFPDSEFAGDPGGTYVTDFGTSR